MGERKIGKAKLLGAGAALSLGVGLLCHAITAHSIERDARERFTNLARNAHYMVSARLKSYLDVLRGSASMFQTNPALSRAQFHRYVSGLGLASNFPGIETINFARRVDGDDLPAYLARMRREPAGSSDGYPSFRLKPPGHRPEYEIIEYIEPVRVWGDRYGYDLRSRAASDRAMSLARDSGAISSSGIPLPILKGPNPNGLAMRLPIYRGDMPAATMAERRDAYLGSIGIGFSVPRLVQGVLDEMHVRDVRLTLSDIATGIVLFDSEATPGQATPPQVVPSDSHFVTEIEIEYTGRRWLASFSTLRADVYTGIDTHAPWLAGVAGFTVSMLLWALFQTLASSRRRAMRIAGSMTRELRRSQLKLQQSHESLRRLAAHADQIKEDERKRIAREIHDDLGQNLLALRIEADLLASRTSQRQPRLHARALATMEQIDATIRSVRQIINDLRPNVLDLGLSAAAEWLIADFSRRSGIACELAESDADIWVDDHCATAFFRILQESLSNVSRHAQASQVRVTLAVAAGVLEMTVADNGRGMAPGARDKSESFGLVGIEERIKLLGGRFAIRSGAGEGTTVCVAVALAGSQELAPAPTAPSENPAGARNVLTEY